MPILINASLFRLRREIDGNNVNLLQLVNFKCFGDHTIFFDNSTIMIGQNNVGKTTVVEALRILRLTTARLRSATVYFTSPEWLSQLLRVFCHIVANAVRM